MTQTKRRIIPNKCLIIRYETTIGSRRHKRLSVPDRMSLSEMFSIIKESFPKDVWYKVRIISLQLNRPFEMSNSDQRAYYRMTNGRTGMGRGIQRGR